MLELGIEFNKNCWKHTVVSIHITSSGRFWPVIFYWAHIDMAYCQFVHGILVECLKVIICYSKLLQQKLPNNNKSVTGNCCVHCICSYSSLLKNLAHQKLTLN